MFCSFLFYVSLLAILMQSGCSEHEHAEKARMRALSFGLLAPDCVPCPIKIVSSGISKGPLRVDPSNPRYFTDDRGRAILLTGHHASASLQDYGDSDPPLPFDFSRYLDFLVRHNHNFIRLSVQEQACWTNVTVHPVFWSPLPYKRTGPGHALDGKPKFDLEIFDEAYFNRLRSRVGAARDRGIYVGIMLFSGWSVARSKDGLNRSNPWHGHPFNHANNVNGINGDLNNDDSGEETHELLIPAVTAIQENYVRRIIDTVNDLDNVLYEVSDESHSYSYEWQFNMIDIIRRHEARKPKQHPVGMTVVYPEGDDERLLASAADWITPGFYLGDSMINRGKVVLDDTDHWHGAGVRIDRNWAWKRFMLGSNPLFTDPYDGYVFREPGGTDFQTTNPQWTSMRLNLGYIQTYANRVELADMLPRRDLVSTGYCLANSQTAKEQFLVYIPQGNIVSVDLSGLPGAFVAEWFDPETGLTVCDSGREGGSKCMFHSPFEWESVLFLHRPSF
jgi:hypothetical protein